jgi:hypothetical protein
MSSTPEVPPRRQALPKEYHEAKAEAVATRRKAIRLKAKLEEEGKHDEAAAVEVPPSTINPEVKEKLLAEAKAKRLQKRKDTWNKWYAEHREEQCHKRRAYYDPEGRKQYREMNKEKAAAASKKRQAMRNISTNDQELKYLLSVAPEHWKEPILGIQQENMRGTISLQQVIILKQLVKSDSPEESDAMSETLAPNHSE